MVIGSVTGKRPLVNRTPYAASKMALAGLVRTLAWEVGSSGVRVNLRSPGGVEGPRLACVLEQQAASWGITVEEARDEFAGGAALHRVVAPEDVATPWRSSPHLPAAGIMGEDLSVSAGSVMH